MDREWLEDQLAEFPLYQYAFIHTDELVFSDRIRYICENECTMYNTTWACPPAVGTVEECKARVMGFSEGLLFGTIVEVSDIANLEETLQTRRPHEEITRQIHEIIKTRSKHTMALSTEACTHCKKCAYPDGPCRFPEKMYPCVESHGIVVSDIAEKYGIDFLAGGNIVTWFSLILYE